MGTIRVIVADDHPVVRSSLRLLLDLEDDIEVVAEAGDIDATLRAVLGHKPDVLLLDLSIPGRSPRSRRCRWCGSARHRPRR